MEGGEAAEPPEAEGHLQEEDPQGEDLQEGDPQREASQEEDSQREDLQEGDPERDALQEEDPQKKDLQEGDPQEQERPGYVPPETSPPEEASPEAELVQQPRAPVFPFDLNQPYDPQAAALRKFVPFFELSSSRQPGTQHTGPPEDERASEDDSSAAKKHPAELADAPLSDEPQSLHSTLSLALSLSSASGSGTVQYRRPEPAGKRPGLGDVSIARRVTEFLSEGFQRAPKTAVGPQYASTAPTFRRGMLEGPHQEGKATPLTGWQQLGVEASPPGNAPGPHGAFTAGNVLLQCWTAVDSLASRER